MSRLIIGVHHVPEPPAGPAIMLATEAAGFTNAVLGGEKWATHAYVAIEYDSNGIDRFRLDGEPYGARWRPDERGAGTWPRAEWAVLRNAEMGAIKARSLDGTKYDWGEIIGQVAAAVGHLFKVRPLQSVALWDATAKYMICSKIVLEVLESCGFKPGLPDLFPERVGQWCREVSDDPHADALVRVI